ncbi:hypothetical protein LTR94_030896 [Friedmanniomyces endolithicus]|nr:hypothetical protein LTR94_030896 [Friedmanniomyces endolithicus]
MGNDVEHLGAIVDSLNPPPPTREAYERSYAEDRPTARDQAPLLIGLEDGIEVSRLDQFLSSLPEHEDAVWRLLEKVGALGTGPSQEIGVIRRRES